MIKIEYGRALHRGSKEPSRSGCPSCLPASAMAPISRFPAIKKPSISSFADVFLPGSAQYVESDVTHSKQTTATFLPGATTPQFGSRTVQWDAQVALSNPRFPAAFLTETASHSEIAVTHSKQTTATFLTETRIACQPFKLPLNSSALSCAKTPAPSRHYGRS